MLSKKTPFHPKREENLRLQLIKMLVLNGGLNSISNYVLETSADPEMLYLLHTRPSFFKPATRWEFCRKDHNLTLAS